MLRHPLKIFLQAAGQASASKSLRLITPAANFCSQKSAPFSSAQKPAVQPPPVKELAPLKPQLTAMPSTDLTLLSVLKGLKESPSPALIYGLGGLIPFVAVPVYTLSSGTFCPLMGSMQLWYGASILSFLGGIRWGLALRTAPEMTFQNLGVSVTSSLVSVAAVAMPYTPGMLTIIAGLSGVAYVDLAKNSSYPRWFKSNRLVLSSVAVASLFSALVLSYTHKKVESKSEAKQQ